MLLLRALSLRGKALHQHSQLGARGCIPVNCWSSCGATTVAGTCALYQFFCSTCSSCRMEAVQSQPEKLNSEIDDLTAEAKAAWDAFMSTTNPQRKTELKEHCKELKIKKEELLSQRHVLQLKLPSSGEHTA